MAPVVEKPVVDVFDVAAEASVTAKMAELKTARSEFVKLMDGQVRCGGANPGGSHVACVWNVWIWC